MICEKCGINTATTHIRTIINGKIQEKHLCRNCAMDNGYLDANNNDLTQVLGNIFGDSVLPFEKKITRCSCCGSSFDDIANSGKCGCSECYTQFYEQLLPYLKRVHGSTEHIGKTPVVELKDDTNLETIESLRESLKALIQEEKYEQAAVVRDKIKALEGDAE